MLLFGALKNKMFGHKQFRRDAHSMILVHNSSCDGLNQTERFYGSDCVTSTTISARTADRFVRDDRAVQNSSFISSCSARTKKKMHLCSNHATKQNFT